MHQIDLSNNEASQSNDKESDKLFDHYDYSTIINLNLTTANHNDYSELLGDSGASAVIFNSAHIDLVAEREEIGEQPFANPRNAASGTMKMQDYILEQVI
jgi:hypothetical protein